MFPTRRIGNDSTSVRPADLNDVGGVLSKSINCINCLDAGLRTLLVDSLLCP
jgi:hypothetical protein